MNNNAPFSVPSLKSNLDIQHLVGLRGVSQADIAKILETANKFRTLLDEPNKHLPALHGLTIVNVFFENSTRTRISFELAEKRLGADVVNFTSAGSSVEKGETLLDTVRNIEAMKVDIAVVRHQSTGVPQFLAENTNAIIVNAGDGCHEHPTQALLDMLTIQRQLGSLEGKRIAIVGDILHSRVARSDIWGLKTMGAEVVLCGPPTLMPGNLSEFGVSAVTKLEDAVRNSDAIITLRLQKERQQNGLLSSEREYRDIYGITEERIKDWNPNALIMHPGPLNRNIELDSYVADGLRSQILEQVTNGVAVRMAVLFLLSGAKWS
jgi:aspartate carbamoyltransferase catalytic subunit